MSTFTPSQAISLVDLLQQQSHRYPALPGYTFLIDDAHEQSLTYGELDRQARAIAASLQRMGMQGERALLLYPPGLAYLAAFFGCLYAGTVAVPAYPPRRNRPTPRLEAIMRDSQVSLLLTTQETAREAAQLAVHAPYLATIPWLATDAIDDQASETWQEPGVGRESLAFLQYTSGSTATPKGVMLTHGNLLHNLELIGRSFEHTPESCGVIWLPPYHDMGLIGGVLQPLYTGFPVVLMAPMTFLQRPFNWLQAVSRYRATTSGGPNFAYELCVQKITPEQRAGLDLSHWRVAFNGAEPINHETLRRFAETFAPCGFRYEAFYPCYGLAEATLIVAGGVRAESPILSTVQPGPLEQNRVEQAEEGRTLVSSGRTLWQQRIVIAHPESAAPCQPREVGEIWVSGPSIAKGYWNRPEETVRTFHATLADGSPGHFLRTGDLGFLQEGELYVTGRLKDLLIIRGRNHYPQDIERTVEMSHEALSPSAGAAFAMLIEGEERLVVAQEIQSRYRHSLNVEEIARAIRQAVAEEHELQVHGILLLRTGSIPKTSSGKIQRHACREGFKHNSLSLVGQSFLDAGQEIALEQSAEEPPIRPVLLATLDQASRHALLRTYLHGRVAGALRVPPTQIDPTHPLNTLGLDSLLAIELAHTLEQSLEVALSPVALLEGITLDQLAAQLLEGLEHAETDSTNGAGRRRPAPTLQPIHLENVPLSFSQQRLWFLDRLASGNTAYNIPVAVQITGVLQLESLQRSINEIVRRHEALRTSFQVVGEEPLQVIHPPFPLEIPIIEVGSLGEEKWEQELHRLARQEASLPFDLGQGALLRLKLLRRNETHHVLLLTMHHIISDGWTMGLFLREMATLYEAFSRGQPSPLPELPIQYADFAYWQRHWLQSEGVMDSLLGYWKQQLGGMPPLLELATDRARPPVQSFRGNHHSLLLPHSLVSALQELGRTEGVTLFMTLLAAVKALLYHYTGREDVVVGTDVANRIWSKSELLMGLFVNQLVLRTSLSGNPTFRELLGRVQRTALAAYDHQELPFDKLVEALKPERNPSYNPLFQVMVVLENAPLPALELADLHLELIEIDGGTAPFDLSLLLSPEHGGLRALFRYNIDLFDASTITRMAGHYQRLLTRVVAQPDTPLSEVGEILAAVDAEQEKQKAEALRNARQQKFARIGRRQTTD